MTPNELEQLLEKDFTGAQIQVEGQGANFNLTIVSDQFSGLMSIKRQQSVYKCLNQLIADGTIHAVTMRLYTLDEWEKARQFQVSS